MADPIDTELEELAAEVARMPALGEGFAALMAMLPPAHAAPMRATLIADLARLGAETLAALQASDRADAARSLHALKGVAGNFDMPALARAATAGEALAARLPATSLAPLGQLVARTSGTARAALG